MKREEVLGVGDIMRGDLLLLVFNEIYQSAGGIAVVGTIIVLVSLNLWTESDGWNTICCGG